MAKYQCVGCGNKHDDFNWKFRDYEDEEGKQVGWFCRKWFTPSSAKEWVPESTKQERIKHAKDMVQPFRGGQLSKEYVDQYPKEASEQFSKKEIKGAKKVWKDIKGLK